MTNFFKLAYKKTVDSKFVKFVKSLVSKIISKIIISTKSFIYIVVDRFKATNIYAYTKRYLNAYKNSSLGIKATSVAALTVLLLVVGFIASGATFAYDINYKGQVIGTVSSKKMCVAAIRLATDEVSRDAKKEISSPKYSLVISFKNRLASKQDLKDAILQNTSSITYASLLKVDGKEVVYVTDENLEEYLKQYRDSFNIEGAESTSDFVEKIEVVTGYFPTEKVWTVDDIKGIIAANVSVKTQATITSEVEIPFSTTKKSTSAKVLGYTQVVTAGVKGTRLSTDTVLFVNGVEVERTNITSEVIKEPVNQVVLVGTAKSSSSAKQKAEAYASGFIFPLNKSSKWKVSSYYGDGRNHKGIDICAPYKTEIYAVAAGTVTYSGYRSDYGYLVVIDHGNGISTAYAHASVLAVKVGERVSAGETIALVGSTGNSTGNHLHFEVRKGTTRLNPAPYIGLG